MSWTSRQIIATCLVCITAVMTYGNSGFVVPVLPQYMRDAGIYSQSMLKGMRIYQNEDLYNGILFAADPIGQLCAQPVSAILSHR